MRALFLAWSILPSAALAGSYCPSPESLRQKVQDCSQNKIYSQAAEACLAKLDAETATAKAQLQVAMANNQAAAADAQSARLQNDAQNLGGLQAKLASLKASAGQAEIDIANYSRGFTQPGPLSDSVVKNLQLDDALFFFPCYGPQQGKLTELGAAFDQRLQDLAKAEQAAAGLYQADSKAVQGIQAAGSKSEVGGPPGVGGSLPAVPAAPLGNPDSDISGTLKEESK